MVTPVDYPHLGEQRRCHWALWLRPQTLLNGSRSAAGCLRSPRGKDDSIAGIYHDHVARRGGARGGWVRARVRRRLRRLRRRRPVPVSFLAAPAPMGRRATLGTLRLGSTSRLPRGSARPRPPGPRAPHARRAVVVTSLVHPTRAG